MAKPTGFWGIDIGQCALKAVRLELQGGKPVATAYDYIEHPKLLSQPDADPDALTREALEKFLARNPVKKDQIGISLAGQNGLVRFVKLPPVEEKKVPDIVKFEAKQQIPFPLDEVVWDFQKVGGGESVGGFAMETEVGLFAMKREIIAKHLGYFQSVKAEVHLVQMAPLALCNFATYETLKKGGPDGTDAPAADGTPAAAPEPEAGDDTPKGKRKAVVVLDIGTDNSNLIITDGGKIIWQRPINLGGSHFTRALTKEMKLTFAKAEHLKRNAAKSPDLAQILRALRPVLTDFVGEVQRSLGFFTNTHRDAHVAYMVGLGNAFRLPGLQKYLSEKLSLEVRKPARLERIGGDAVLGDPNFSENLLTFPVALGLALQGLGLARLHTNLLPAEIRTERLIRAKKPWAAAAAAALVVGSGVVALGEGVQLAAMSDPRIKKSIGTSGQAVSAATAQNADRAKKEADVAAAQAEVKTIIAGNDERLNWVRLNEVLVAALPRHGDAATGGNLDDPDQLEFWRTANGPRALELYKKRLKSGVPLEELSFDNMSQYLAAVNVEVVYCRWTDNPGLFLTAADTFAKQKYNRDIADEMLDAEREQDAANGGRFRPKPPEGAGWWFEVRGSTTYGSGLNFLRKGLVRNLQKFDKFADQTFGDSKMQTILPGVPDPVKGKVSHAFLLAAEEAQPNAAASSSVVGTSWTDRFIAGSSPAAPGAGPGSSSATPPPGAAAPPGVAGTAAPPAAAWVPLGGAGPAGGAGGYPGPEAQPGYPGSVPTPTDPKGPKTKPRTDFVACFFWKEPIPSDAGPAATTAATPAAPGVPPPPPVAKK